MHVCRDVRTPALDTVRPATSHRANQQILTISMENPTLPEEEEEEDYVPFNNEEPVKVYTFPTTIQQTILSGEQRAERYGIPRDAVPRLLSQQLKAFTLWSQQPINLSRSLRFSHGVQQATMEGQLNLVRGYCGYVCTYHRVPVQECSLQAYRDPELIASFISYLRARQVTKYPLLAHAGRLGLPCVLGTCCFS